MGNLNNYCNWVPHIWELLFEQPFIPNIDDWGGYSFMQIAVSRDAMLRRPRSFWERAWQALARQQNYQLLPGTRFISWRTDGLANFSWHKGVEIAMEHLPHVLFFPHAKSRLWPTRLHDATVPLSFKVSMIDGAHNP